METTVSVCVVHSILVLACQAGWVVLKEYRTSYLSGPVSKPAGWPQRKISSASMVWLCDRLTGGLGFAAEEESDRLKHRSTY